MKKRMVCCILILIGFGCAVYDKNNRKEIVDIIPLTTANIHGHKMLYNEGWFVVSSSKKAFSYAQKKSFVSSYSAISAIADSVGQRTAELREGMGMSASVTYTTTRETFKKGTGVTGKIIKKTNRLVKSEYDFTKDSFQDAWDTMIYGNISIVKRTGKDVKKLAGLPGHYFKNLKNDFSNIFELSASANNYASKKINLSWERSFDKAVNSFQKEYVASGRQQNSLMALGNILSGYMKALYHGLVKPSAKSIVELGAKGSNYGVFLPGAAATIVTGRTIESVGLSLYYTTKTGYQIVTPTIESGLLGGVALLSLGAMPVTYVGGTAFGAVNQVAFTTAAPVVGSGKGLMASGGQTGKYVALVSYDIGKGTTDILINQASAGIVLGYNALTAVPAHMFLGSVDTAVFLAWDGPRLVVAMATGKIKPGISTGGLPSGTVVDLKKLRQIKNIDVKIMTEDPEVIKQVIEKLPEDLRGKDEE